MSYENDKYNSESVDSDDSEDEPMNEEDESFHIEDEEMECNDPLDESDGFETEEETETCVSLIFSFILSSVFVRLHENLTISNANSHEYYN